MKKIFGLLSFVLLCGVLFTSFSPSLDGRAVVAAEGVMPKGVFAKTVGYLPGDSISVTSLTTKTTVDILVIGSIDSSEGIAILLSPEAADLLGLSRDSNNVVKITKRSGQLDEAVAGTAIIGGAVENSLPETDSVAESENNESTDEENTDEIPDYSDSTGNAESNLPESGAEETLPTTSEPEEETLPTETYLFDDEVTDSSEDEENEVEVIEATKPVDYENDTLEEPEFSDVIEQTTEPVEEPSVQDETVSEPEEIFDSEKINDDFADSPVEENLPSESVEQEELSEETPDGYEAVTLDELDETENISGEQIDSESFDAEDALNPDYSEKVDYIAATEEEPAKELEVPVESAVGEVTEESSDSEKVDMDNLDSLDEEKEGEKTQEELTDSESSEKVAEIPFDEERYSSVVPSDDLESVTSEEESVSETPYEEESYEPIVLVPTESNPPETVEEVTDENTETVAETSANEETNETEENNEAAESPVEFIAPIVEKTDKSVKTSVPEKQTADLSDYVVPSLKQLEKGKFYVQIAVLANEENIRSVIAKYGEQYPIVLVPLAKGSYQVLVGPLTMDEYGTVHNRFKSYGYKDAFLRRIK